MALASLKETCLLIRSGFFVPDVTLLSSPLQITFRHHRMKKVGRLFIRVFAQ